MKFFGGPPNGTPQPEWSISDDGLGMLTGTLRIFIDGSSKSEKGGLGRGNSLFNKYSGNNGLTNPKPTASNAQGGLAAGVPKKGDPHPFDSRLRCFGVSLTRNSMGIGYAEAQYVGLLSEPAGLEWELSCPTEEDAIETHPNFLNPSFADELYGSRGIRPNLYDKVNTEEKDFKVVTQSGINPQTKGPYWNMSNVYIDGPTQSFKGFRASEWNIQQGLLGVESYKVPRANLRISYTTSKREFWTWAVDNLGKWTNRVPAPFVPQGYQAGGGTVPSQNFSWNWLLVNVSVSEASGLYKVSIEFMGSGRRGWNNIIYDSMLVEQLEKTLVGSTSQ